MANGETLEVIRLLNTQLQTRYNDRDPIEVEVNGRPHFSITSFEPVEYDRFGMVINRAPTLVGWVSLRALIPRPLSNDRANIVFGVEASNRGYGFVLNSYKFEHRAVLAGVAEELGHPIEFTP